MQIRKNKINKWTNLFLLIYEGWNVQYTERVMHNAFLDMPEKKLVQSSKSVKIGVLTTKMQYLNHVQHWRKKLCPEKRSLRVRTFCFIKRHDEHESTGYTVLQLSANRTISSVWSYWVTVLKQAEPAVQIRMAKGSAAHGHFLSQAFRN